MEKIMLSSGVEINKNDCYFNFKRIINQVYKLLPLREEKQEWTKPLETLIQEISGMKRLIIGQDNLFLPLLCKMEGLFDLTQEEDMTLYRRIIFECLGLLNSLQDNVCNR